MKDITILGIETSCDETAASIVSYNQKNNSFKVLSHTLSSQIKIHAKYGGVFPELAARSHTEKIIPIIKNAFDKAKINIEELDGIAVTYGPGLVGSLIIGTTAASTYSYLYQKPLIAVNHLEGHIYSNINELNKIKYPLLVLIVSGGHTLLALSESLGNYKLIGETLDDAAGEAFDKIGKLLGLAYPCGPALSALAKKGDKNKYRFSLPLNRKNNYNFSFSGLKTAFLYKFKSLNPSTMSLQTKADLASSFEATLVNSLVKKTILAAINFNAKTVLIGGGVSANELLRDLLSNECKKNKILFIKPLSELCTDNAIGIACAGAVKFNAKKLTDWKKLKVDPVARLC